MKKLQGLDAVALVLLGSSAALGLVLGTADWGAAETPPAPHPSPSPTAAETRRDEPALVLQERVMVVGSASLAESIPGSAHYLGAEELLRRKVGFDDVHRLLQPVPGVHVQDEEGYGHRPNIGLRGAGSDRSAKITLLEDGVLVAPAPYAAPAAYYFPVTGRMSGLEVRKGSSQIRFGPHTTGGALNLISAPIPASRAVQARIEGGPDRTGKLHANAGASLGPFGFLLETYQATSDGFKDLDGGGTTGFRLEDYLGKLRLQSGADARVYQQVELKLGYTRDDSDETYLGLTEEDFRDRPLRRYAASQRDRLEARHEQYQARYFAALPGGFDVTATAYRNEFFRNWYKLDRVLGRAIGDVLEQPDQYAAALAVLKGGDSPADALVVRANQREYFSEGVETRLGVRQRLASADHQLELGVRWHRDQEDRFQHDDAYRMSAQRMELTRAGAPGSQTNRVGDATAWAFFLEDRVRLGRWQVTPGLRWESIRLEGRTWGRTDPERAAAPSRVLNDVDMLIPGLGVSVEARSDLTLFAGLHKGFSPPGPGSSDATRSEESWNGEMGGRVSRGSLRAELLGFLNDYENLLGRDTLSSGGTGSGDLFNGGAVRMAGLEASLTWEAGKTLGIGVSLPMQLSYTLTSAHFRSRFVSTYEPWGTVAEGDELPYLPEHRLFAGLGLRAGRLGAQLSASYVSAMRTEAGQGAIPEGSGTDAQFIVDAEADWNLGKGVSVFGAVQNLTDAVDVVARRPAGARPGLPRTFMAGVRLAAGR
jgi:Fe(3+) dicitrate transport protein